MLGIGIWAKKLIRSLEDYLLAGRRLGLVLAVATLAATHYGGGFVLGGASWGVKYGLGGIWYGAACGIGLILLGVTFAKLSRALALYTVPEILVLRYRGYSVQAISALLSLLALIGILGAQVWAAGAIFEALGLPGVWGSVLATVIFIVYTAISGLWAVTITDLAQIIIGTIGVLAATLIALMNTGGFIGIKSKLYELYSMGVINALPEEYFNVFSPGTAVIALTVTATVMYTLIGQDFYQRLFASKNEKTAIKASLLSGIFLVVISFLPPIAGVSALALSPSPQEIVEYPRTAIPRLILTVLGPGVGALFLTAILAAVMSTADSLLLAATSHVVRDFYYKFNARINEKEMLNISIVVTVIIGFFSLLAALTVRGVIELLIYSYDLYTSGVFMPLIFGLVWKRATKEGAIAAMIAGFAATLMGIFNLIPVEIYEVIYVWGALVSLIIMVTVSLLTKPTQPDEKLAKLLKWS
jgi:Na+/proline symporter